MMGRTRSIHERCQKGVQFFLQTRREGNFRRLRLEWQDNIKWDVSSSGSVRQHWPSLVRARNFQFTKGWIFVDQLSYCLASLVSGVCYWVRTSALPTDLISALADFKLNNVRLSAGALSDRWLGIAHRLLCYGFILRRCQQLRCMALNVRMIDELEINGRGWFAIPSRHLTGRPEEEHERLWSGWELSTSRMQT
jgi:hypothetical protein